MTRPTGWAGEEIAIEASSVCQLRCPSCPTTTGAIAPVVGGGFLKARDFRRLIDDNPGLRRVELSNYGEAFLNPELLEILEYAHSRGVALSLDNGVNLNSASEEALEGLVKYGVRDVTCSIDGATDEVYRLYRRRGELSAVLDNVRKINAHKKRYRSARPRLTWQFVVFGHNEHELAQARRMARALGMAFKPKMSWDDAVSPLKDRERVKRETGWAAADRAEHERARGEAYKRTICHQLWTRPQVNWDGKLLGCCFNFWGDFGPNVLTAGLAESLGGEKIAYARRMLMGEAAPREEIPCSTCSLYGSMKARGNWLTAWELGLSPASRVYRTVRGLPSRWLSRLRRTGRGRAPSPRPPARGSP